MSKISYFNHHFRNIKFEIISDKDKNLSLDLFQIIKPRITVSLISNQNIYKILFFR